MSAAARGRLGFAALAVVALLAAGGAASWPGGGYRLGWPGLAVCAAIAGCAAGLGFRLPERGAPALGLLPLILLLVLAPPLPGLRALTGGPLSALAIAGLLLAFPVEGRVLALLRRAFLPVVAACLLLGAYRVQAQVGPEGDEPHYLMVADSLLRDGDLSLEQDYAEGRYRAFVDRPLEPHYRVRGRGGEIYSLHALGLSLLVLPAYALGGYAGASFFMAGLGVALALELRRLLLAAIGDEPAAEAAAWVVALSPPLLSYSGLVFTEVPAALGVAFALRQGLRGGALPVRTAAATGAVLAALPWLNVRYAVLSALLAAFLLAARPGWSKALALLAPGALGALALGAYHQILYGFLDPRRVYGRRPEFALSTLREGLPGLLLDQEFGLLVYAPVFALAAAGGGILWRRDRRLALAALGLVGAVVLTAGTWHMWRGGFNPPARFLVPVVPVLALGIAAAWTRGITAPAALLAGWGLWLGAAGLHEPRLVHRDRDGTAPMFRAVSGAEEWTRLLPGYVLGEEDRSRIALVWAATLALAVAWRGRGGAAGLAGASLGLLAAAGAASSISDGRTAGRDAVRLVGRPALERAPPRFVAAAPARWGLEALSWGPAYEPHRFPSGAPLGERLRLPAGAFTLEIRAERLDAGSSAPRLAVVDGGSGGETEVALAAEGDGYRACFERPRPSSDLTLRVRGGGAFLLEWVELRAQPSCAGPV